MLESSARFAELSIFILLVQTVYRTGKLVDLIFSPKAEIYNARHWLSLCGMQHAVVLEGSRISAYGAQKVPAQQK